MSSVATTAPPAKIGPAKIGPAKPGCARTLDAGQVSFFWEHGFLRIEQVYTPAEMDELDAEMERLMVEWARLTPGWSGDWRKAYMDAETEKKANLRAMHDLWLYSAAFARAVINPRLVGAVADLIGPNVELHHSTMHVKPPSTGQPFPLHQDNAFYVHGNERYVDALIHLDDTCHENGEIRFLDGSHRGGPLDHIRRTATGERCTPHLPTDRWRLADTVAVPAARGDVVLFDLFTIHGSYLNQTDRARRLVRVGYRDPDNRQVQGQSALRPGWIVAGKRSRAPGDELFDNQSIPADRDR